MLWIFSILCLLAWVAAMANSYMFDGAIHVLLVLGVVALVCQLIARRNSAV